MKKFNFIDATLIVAGSMIGSGIFLVSSDMALTVGSSGWLIVLWLISGLMTLLAALSYGELAGMMPKAGGQYVYLKESFNSFTAFLYGWTLFVVIQCGSIAAVAVAFAKFASVLVPEFGENNILFQITDKFAINAAQITGIASILVLTLINRAGLKYGKLVNEIFSSTKLVALFGLIVLGIFVFGKMELWNLNWQDAWHAQKFDSGSGKFIDLTGMALVSAIGVGLVGSLFSSDAWNNVTFISGDIENPKKNIPLSLLFGTLIVCLLYILANVAYLFLLPIHGTPGATDTMAAGIQFAAQDRVGVAAAMQIFGNPAVIIMAVLIMISTFGCNNSIVLSSVKVYQEMAKDGLFFDKMKNDNKNGVPEFALWVQFIWSSALCLSGKYGDLLDYVMFAVILFYILTIAGLFVLRYKKPDAERPYKAFGYPILPALYILLAAAFCYNLLIYKQEFAVGSLVIVAIGIPVYFLWKFIKKAPANS
ncbi:MAG: amino acid permease [Bacteroidota bacterium]